MVNEGVYTDSKLSFSHDNGFAVAAAITYGDLSWDQEPLEDPEIGQLKFLIKSWTEGDGSELIFREL